MDRWLGKVVTIWGVCDSYAIIEEEADKPIGFAWSPNTIDHIVTDDELLPDTDFDAAPDETFATLFS